MELYPLDAILQDNPHFDPAETVAAAPEPVPAGATYDWEREHGYTHWFRARCNGKYADYGYHAPTSCWHLWAN